MSLEHKFLHWLKWEKKCWVVLTERKPVWNLGNPDVWGLLPSRYQAEIEIKRTLADFRADAVKRHIRNRDIWLAKFPRLFWYGVPPTIADAVRSELPPWAGLLVTAEDYSHSGRPVEVAVRSPVNKESKKLTLNQCARLLNLCGNQIYSMSNYLFSKQQITPPPAKDLKPGDTVIWYSTERNCYRTLTVRQVSGGQLKVRTCNSETFWLHESEIYSPT